MTSMEEWQLDAIESVMRRCDALSDFSTEQIARTLEQMGFTIARRTSPSVSERARRNCSKITPHAAHNFSDYALLLRCPGVAGKPKTQKRGPSPSLVIVDEVPDTFFQRKAEEPTTQIPSESTFEEKPCADHSNHVPHMWGDNNEWECLGVRIDEPACTKTEPHPPHIWEENDLTYGCRGVTGEEEEVTNLSEAFEKTPIDSNWIHRIPTVESSNECRVTGVFFKNRPEGKVFFVQHVDTWDRKHEAPLSDFLRGWERV